MNKDGTLGSMMQGVSQQPAGVRPDGKVTEQINMISDFVSGLSSRPPLDHIGFLSGAVSGLAWKDVELNGTKYILGFKADTLLAWKQDGTSVTVVPQDAAALAYLSTDMAGYAYDDVLYMTNRNKIVQRSATLNGSQVLQNYALVYCLGGKFSRVYTFSVTYADGTTAVGSFTTPGGTATGDGDKTDSRHIAEQLRTAFLAHGSLKVGTTCTRVENTLYIAYSGPVTITATDGEQNISLRAHSTTVSDLENLSRFAPHGAYVRVTGSDEGTQDDYYLRFKSATTATLGTGFGKEGVWEEWYDVSQSTDYNTASMPHVIFESGGSIYLERNDWVPRRVGDDETNPFPDFIGRKIRDISGFDSRLVMVAGPNVHMSRTKVPGDFFKKTVLAELPSDAIEANSIREGKVELDWIVQFDRDLVLVSNNAKGQYIIQGGSALTPQNVSVPLTTSFDVKGIGKPVRTGKTILLPFVSGKYAGLNEFYAYDNIVSNGVDALTATLDRYISGQIKHMECSTNFNTVLLTTDDPFKQDTLYVYKYLWEGQDRAQSAWGRWVLPGAIEWHWFDGGLVYVVVLADGLYSLLRLDLDNPANAATGYAICLDRRMTGTVDALSTANMPAPGLSFVQGAGCESVGRGCTPITETALGGGLWAYSFDPVTVPSGASVFAGKKFMRSVWPTMPRVRDRNGNVVTKFDLSVNDFLITVEDSGSMSATMHCKFRPDATIDFDWFPLDGDPLDPTAVGIRSGVLEVPWGERADWSELEIHSDDVRPTTIITVQWTGESES